MTIGLGARRRTILLIDADAHARASLRLALEAADFTVGEAASGAEGERTAARVRLDAILVDLIAGVPGDATTLPERLHAKGVTAPCFVISAAADALVGSVGLHELGVAGVFLKPADAPVIIRTLRTRLGMDRGPSPHARGPVMHEMSLVESLVDLVDDESRRQAFARVRVVRLQIGILGHAEPEALRFCFEAIARGTVAEGARLEIEMCAGEGWCPACRDSAPMEDRLAGCPMCGGVLLMTAGDELRLTELEVD
jgi:hydrogenase nickel insertion protein HypA